MAELADAATNALGFEDAIDSGDQKNALVAASVKVVALSKNTWVLMKLIGTNGSPSSVRASAPSHRSSRQRSRLRPWG